MKLDKKKQAITWTWIYNLYAWCLYFCRGFSVVDLLEDARTHTLHAMKRITCHGMSDERIAMNEIEVMKSVRHKNLVPLEEYSTITVGCHVQSQDPITEVLIVMPFYRVSLAFYLYVSVKEVYLFHQKSLIIKLYKFIILFNLIAKICLN